MRDATYAIIYNQCEDTYLQVDSKEEYYGFTKKTVYNSQQIIRVAWLKNSKNCCKKTQIWTCLRNSHSLWLIYKESITIMRRIHTQWSTKSLNSLICEEKARVKVNWLVSDKCHLLTTSKLQWFPSIQLSSYHYWIWRKKWKKWIW